MAECITVIGIFIGFSMIIIDMGRPDRLMILPFALKLESPLFWDFLSVSTYLTGSFIFFYLPLIPDFAILRDKFEDKPGFDIRKPIYKILAIGWQGTPSQKKHLDRSITFMSIILVPIAILCHTVIAFIFAMTWRVGWHSTIFGPYFVVAAIFSGTAAIIIAMTILRKLYHYEEHITQRHFRNMGWILLVFLAGYFYFTATEYFTTAYRGLSHDMELMEELFLGIYAFQFWSFIVLGMTVPGLILFFACWKFESEKAVWAIFSASVLIVVGMWIKRYMIIVPALARPFVAQEWTPYNPTWVEWAITIAASAGFILAFTIFAKIIPMISLWELEEERHKKAMILSELEETIRMEEKDLKKITTN
jgi:molybdopterin-containing oxidoreductase family membrane subunit